MPGVTVKVIFSRKGFDGTAGGCPSPIIDGMPLSLPIPTRMPTATRFRDLGGLYGDLVSDLTRGKLTPDSWCHLDPDIDNATLPRTAGWRGALGQVAAAQGHLENQGVQRGDLFIFWGLFREAVNDGRWRFVGPSEHRIWGWLQIEEVICLGADGSHALTAYPWLRDHPHIRPGWGNQNTLYIASEEVVIGSRPLGLPGAGVLAEGFRLSAGDERPSLWRVPDWVNPTRGGSGMTYHPPERWSADGTVQGAARGQEFVAAPAPDSDATEWISALLQGGL